MLAFVYGAWSAIVPPEVRERQLGRASLRKPLMAIAAGHHDIMIDQPLALLTMLRT